MYIYTPLQQPYGKRNQKSSFSHPKKDTYFKRQDMSHMSKTV